jgi:hypothetical protein
MLINNPPFTLNSNTVNSTHLVPTGVVPNIYGLGNQIPSITVGADGRVTSVVNTPISALSLNSLTVSGNVNYTYGGTSVTPAPLLNGSSSSLAAPNAKYLVDVCNITTNGVYWINLPTVGATQVYCILDTNCAGGGWMLAMKATRGTTFNFAANYWTTNNTLNPTDLTTNDGDAKYHVYNYYNARDWLAIWPDVGYAGGDISGGYLSGWTWIENNATGSGTPLLTFMNSGLQITKASNGVVYSATDPSPLNTKKWNASIWSNEGGFIWYGLNYTGNSSSRVRWGWAMNNESDQTSNDLGGGIGLDTGRSNYSAGDQVSCCAVTTGLNRSMRVLWFVR